MDHQNNPDGARVARPRALPAAAAIGVERLQNAAKGPSGAREGGVLVEASVQAGRAELGQIIERRIAARTWRRIRQLRVEVCAERVVVHGQTPRYHAKQLAIQAVLEALREAGVTAAVDVRIRVSAPLGRDHQLGRAKA
jgi:hypothetical protein